VGEATGARQKQAVYVTRVEVVQKQTLWNYQREKHRAFLKITVALPNMVTVARGVLEKGLVIPGLNAGSLMLPTFESNVLYILRFMVDCNVSGGNWVSLPAGSWRRTAKPVSTCQLEVDIMASALVSHAAEGPHSAIAKFRILSVDIECAGRKVRARAGP